MTASPPDPWAIPPGQIEAPALADLLEPDEIVTKIPGPKADDDTVLGASPVPPAAAYFDASMSDHEIAPPSRPEDRKYVSGVYSHGFPYDTCLLLWRELYTYFLGASLRVKIIAGAVAAVLLVLFITVLIALFGSDRSLAYVREIKPLFVGPSDQGVYRQGASLERGSEVEVIETSREYSLVKDAFGRVGYLHTSALAEKPPKVEPAQPFADCPRSLTDISLARCQGRAQQQFELCRTTCAEDPSAASCAEHCHTRLLDCVELCEQGGPPPDPLAEAQAKNDDAASVEEAPKAQVEAVKKKVKRPPKKKRAR